MPAASANTEIHLYRHMRTAWREAVVPWLGAYDETGTRKLTRNYIVVPTRGQSHAFKQECLIDGIPLLGVELLTPGLARRKWLTHLNAAGAQLKPAIGREFLLLGLRTIIDRHLRPLTPDQASWGVLKSLQSDCERALDDFDDLIKSGYTAKHFPLAELQTIFGELTTWVDDLDYDFAPRQTADFVRALQSKPICARAPIPGRLLIHGFSAEQRGEFFNIAALAQCFADVTLTLPEPEFRGRKALDESWIELWEKTLDAVAVPLDEPDLPESCENVAEHWATTDLATSAHSLPTDEQARVIVGVTRADEMELVVREIAERLALGAKNIAVIFPASDAAHIRLAQLLSERGIPFVDQLETAGAPPIEVRAQRALLAFYWHGGRLEELLELWPLLHALGQTPLPLASARDVSKRLFDANQTHALSECVKNLPANERIKRPEWREFARVAALLLGEANAYLWPDQIVIDDALKRFAAACARFELGDIPGWSALEEFARREKNAVPSSVVFLTLDAFLPSQAPATDAPGRGCFARVMLTTRRRIEGAILSHMILVESNAGVWPARQEADCWLPDEARVALNKLGHGGIDLFTADDLAFLEKRSYAALARDTSQAIVFSAALFNEEDPELKLAPNSWVERLRWDMLTHAAGGETPDHAEVFDRLAQSVAHGGTTSVSSSDRTEPVPPTSLAKWHSIWLSRRNPELPFDDYFFCVDPKKPEVDSLAARQIEAGVDDPATLWFDAVLRAPRIDWLPFARTPKVMLGQLAHNVLARALRGDQAERNFQRMPEFEAAAGQMARELAVLRASWPADAYWDSFHLELSEVCRALLKKVFALNAGDFVATEFTLPPEASVPIGSDGTRRLRVHGRMDLMRLDRPDLRGAKVDIVDFKTGADAAISAAAMSTRGASLQLGIYLAAAQSLGATEGRVWLFKPGANPPASMGMEELPVALERVAEVYRHVHEGRYGALTADRTDYSFGNCEWPIACAPISSAILKKKYEATFGGGEDESAGAHE